VFDSSWGGGWGRRWVVNFCLGDWGHGVGKKGQGIREKIVEAWAGFPDPCNVIIETILGNKRDFTAKNALFTIQHNLLC
jgi:hypothetical protein